MHRRSCFGVGADTGSEVKARNVGDVWEQLK